MKRFLLAALLLLILSSCGYTMAGLNNEIPVKYYINTVHNDTIDSAIGDIMQLEQSSRPGEIIQQPFGSDRCIW